MKFKYLVCSAAMLLALAGCNQPASGGDPVVETVSVTGVALNKTTVALTVNQTETLTATITPANATNKNVTWSASGDGVVSVVDGLVRALKPGTSTVTATTVDGGYTANCEVTVSAATVAVTGVTLNKASLSLTVGDSETLTATVAPSDATNKNVTWSVTGDAVTVNNGTVTAAKAGEATVTVTTADGRFTANCAVTVKEAKPAVVPAGGPKTNMTFGEEHDWATGVLNLPDDKFVYWNAHWDWSSGAQVNVNEGDAYTEEGTVTATYSSEANSNCAFGFQIFYKNTSLTAGKDYTLSYTLTSTLALNVTANGAQVALEAGVAVNVVVDYKENANDASFALVTPVVGAFTNTLVISNISWVEK